jgi:hypothetical protein
MIRIRQPTDANLLPTGEVRDLILDGFKMLSAYEGDYTPETHGWFLIMETPEDLTDRSVFYDRFDLAEAVSDGLAEHVVMHTTCVEVVVALTDAEAVAVFLPKSLAGALHCPGGLQ